MYNSVLLYRLSILINAFHKKKNLEKEHKKFVQQTHSSKYDGHNI